MSWEINRSLKYAATRLMDIGGDRHSELCEVYLGVHQDHQSALSPTDRVMGYWIDQSTRCEQQGNFFKAIDFAMLAGWDVGLSSMPPYRLILERVIRLAENSNQTARAELARTHLASFEQRYG